MRCFLSQLFVKSLIIPLILLTSFQAFGQRDGSSGYSFLTPASSQDIELESTSDRAILEYRVVDIKDFMDQPLLNIELFNGVSIQVKKWFLDIHPNGSISWAGKIVGQQWGQVIISRTNDTYWGKIELDNGTICFIQPLKGSEQYVLSEVQFYEVDEGNCGDANLTEDEFLQEKFDIRREEESNRRGIGDLHPSICDSSSTCSVDTVFLLVVYNETARTDLGGTDPAAISAIATAVTEMNTINSNSLVTHKFSLAAAKSVSYTESGSSSIDLARLEGVSDGFVDEVHEWRREYSADLVSMVLGDGACGRGNLNFDDSYMDPNSSFSIASDGCLTGNKTLAHEAGHNLGLMHDRYASYIQDTLPVSFNICDWAWGYVNEELDSTDGSSFWRTVLAYNNQCSDFGSGFACTRIPYWSNPEVSYLGDPTGKDIGSPDTLSAHNAFTVERSICVVSDFINNSSDCPACDVSIQCEAYNLLVSSSAGIKTSFTFSDASYLNPFSTDDVTICVTLAGDHGSSSEQFELIVEDSDTIGATTPTGFDCNFMERECYTVSSSVYNSWVDDGIVEMDLSTTDDGIDLFCANNFGCIEIFTLDTVTCIAGGIYTGTGVDGQVLPTGTYSFTSAVTLKNFIVKDGSDVTVKCPEKITLDKSFEVEDGAKFKTVVGGCP